ncbi:hypothetical protein LTR95_005578 [Oleoguttula sp. CCFEE 5521]
MSTQATYECAICCEDEIRQDKIEHVDGDLVCHTCISKRFRAALRKENEYPARLGTFKLSISDYHHVFEPEFWIAYAKKEIEYDCPPLPVGDDAQSEEECNAFVDALVPVSLVQDAADVQARLSKQSTCSKCDRPACLICSAAFEAGHACDMTSWRTVVSEEQALAATGLIRSQDCQLCPNELCLRLIQMETGGCGFVICTCGEGLCFFCGITWDGRTQHECLGLSRATEQIVGIDSPEQSRASRADSGIPPDQQFDDNPAVIESRALLDPIVRIRHAMHRDIRWLFRSGIPHALRPFTTPPGHEGEMRADFEGESIRDFFTLLMQAVILDSPENSLARQIRTLSLILRRIDWFVLDLEDTLEDWGSQRRT